MRRHRQYQERIHSAIVAEKARLDFDIELSMLTPRAIESETNALIASGSPPRASGSPTPSSTPAGARQTMSVRARRRRPGAAAQIPGIDLQPCGGTHVATSPRSARSACCGSAARARQQAREIGSL